MNILSFLNLLVLSRAREVIPPCSSYIYCYGPLLDAAQSAFVFNDSKSFVDMKMKKQPDRIYDDFLHLLFEANSQLSDENITSFVKTNFENPGKEFEIWYPDDWKENPKFLNYISDKNLRLWSKTLHSKWKDLGRKIKDDVLLNSELYSIIYVPNAVIVPGGRFREYYYWDTYWVVRGLLQSEMYSTVKGILENLLFLVKKYGFIPNGGRIYYTERSQPPFITLMTEEYIKATGDFEFLKTYIGVLSQEHYFWTQNRSVIVQGHLLSVYKVKSNLYRPESYREDKGYAEKLKGKDKQEWMENVASACESGWDFSSRWSDSNLEDSDIYDETIMTLDTKNIVPVDLNSILAKTEKTLANFYLLLGNMKNAAKYNKLYKKRTKGIEEILWNNTAKSYFDYNLNTKKHNTKYFASNFNLLWSKSFSNEVDQDTREKLMYATMKDLGVLEYPGGIPTSLIKSGHQWDFPNAWPPLVHLVIEGLAESKSEKLRKEAYKQAQKWINCNYELYQQTSNMFEKYDVRYSNGKAGTGGEYNVQEGFGWTNAVVLNLINRYNSSLTVRTSGKAKSCEINFALLSSLLIFVIDI